MASCVLVTRALARAAERETERHLERIWLEARTAQARQHPSFEHIPRFYFKSDQQPTASGSRHEGPSDQAPSRLRDLVVAEARSRLLDRKASLVLDKGELERFWFLLTEHISTPTAAEVQGARTAAPGAEPELEKEERIHYDDVRRVAEQLPRKAQTSFMRATHFLKFPIDWSGRIAVGPYFQWVMRKNDLMQARLDLAQHDAMGTGRLTEQQLEGYLRDLLPSLLALSGLEEAFTRYYVVGAARKFLFFLDPKRRGYVRLRALLSSPILHELFELKREHLTEDEHRNNWFSLQTANAVYAEYLSLDEDEDGMLNAEELAHYGEGGLTRPFINKLFQECQTYEGGKIDYTTYLDFVLATWYKKTDESLGYFFRLLDVQKRGRLGVFEINYFFKAIIERSREAGQEPVSVEDVKDEIFDMVKPRNDLYISLQDLIDCKVGDTVVSMLTDVNGFWAYDNRES